MIDLVLKKIKTKRNEKGFSQEFVAQQMNISQSYYTSLENGKRKLTVVNLIKIAEILESNPIAFFNQEENNLKEKLKKEIIDELSKTILIQPKS